jgi:hypothetical protein
MIKNFCILARRSIVVLRSYAFGAFLGFIARKNDVCIVSPGGVATTFFMEFIANYLKVNDPYDRDRLKHVACPPIFRRKIKYIYIHGEPKSIVLSLAKRGYLQYQIHKNGRLLIGCTVNSLDDYLNTGSDLLRLKPCLSAWQREEANSGQVLTLHFEDIWKRKAEWGAFLGLSEQVLDLFPERRDRYSDSIRLTAQQSAELNKIY